MSGQQATLNWLPAADAQLSDKCSAGEKHPSKDRRVMTKGSGFALQHGMSCVNGMGVPTRCHYHMLMVSESANSPLKAPGVGPQRSVNNAVNMKTLDSE